MSLIDENSGLTDFEYFLNKKTDRIYLSKSLETTQFISSSTDGIIEIKRPIRILSKLFDGQELHHFVKEGKELVLRITPSSRQEVVAKFYEDTRGVFTLQIQRYTRVSGNPHQISFSFVGEEIAKLYNFIRNIAVLPIKDRGSQKFDDKFIEEIVLTKEQHMKIISQNPEIINEILKNNITHAEIFVLGKRKEQLKKFENLLNDPEYFQSEKKEYNLNGDESVWQKFFEENTWILGYGLNFIFNAPLEGKKLEQVVKGHSLFDSGKRVDVLLKTKSLISSLCFGEIKTHYTPLLKSLKNPYRSECWASSDDLSGGIIQIQKSVQKSVENIKTKTDITDEIGNLTGEELYLYQPKSFLIIGSLSEFLSEKGINKEKFSSFELFRRNLYNPEILTFDELFERAKFIVESESS